MADTIITNSPDKNNDSTAGWMVALVLIIAVEGALTEEGYDVVASESYGGIESVTKNSPDLILLDVFLEDQDGRDITHELKSNVLTMHLPIVLFSAYPGIEKLAEETGADGFLSKPFELEELLTLVRKQTQRPV